MKNPFISSVYFFLFTLSLFAQSPTLVQDFIPGPQGSADGRLYELDGKLIYEGVTPFGEKAILQYDKISDQITVLATNDDFEGQIRGLLTTDQYLIIQTGTSIATTYLYKASNNDLSDLEMIYDAGDALIRGYRFFEEHILIVQEAFNGVDYSVDMHTIYPDNSVVNIFNSLPGRIMDYSWTILQGHVIVTSEVEPIDGQYIAAFDISSQSLVPITNLIPDFNACGPIDNSYGLLDIIFHFSCDNDYIYDLEHQKFIPFTENNTFIRYVNDQFLYLYDDVGLYRIDRQNGAEERLLDEIKTYRGYFYWDIYLTYNGDVLDIVLYDFEKEEMYTYPTTYPNDENYRFTGFGVVETGIHTVIYESTGSDGVIVRLNDEGFVEIDSVYNVSYLNRPTACEEDIYFVHDSPEYGNELFYLDYLKSSTIETTMEEKIIVCPNPAQDYIELKYPKNRTPRNAHILNWNGAWIQQISDFNRQDVSHLTPGIYFIQTTYTDQSSSIIRFVIF